MTPFERSLLCIIYLFCTICCSWWLFVALRRIARGSKYAQDYFYLLYFLFYVFPVIIQLVQLLRGSNVTFVTLWATDKAMENLGANIQYAIFMLILGGALIWSRRIVLRPVRLCACDAGDGDGISGAVTYSPALVNILSLIILFPLIYIIVSGNGGLLFAPFGARWESDIALSETSITLTVPAYLIILGTAGQMRRKRLIVLTLVMLAYFWVVAKRYLIVEVLVLAIFTLDITGQIKPKRLVKLLFVAAIALLVFCIMYGFLLKGNLNSVLEYFTVDLSRQYSLVYQFYCKQIHRSISPEALDAVGFILLVWVPRVIWPGKPLPFANSLTWSMLGASTPMRENLGWGTTCALFNELFDSFSYLGLFLGVVVIIAICQGINHSRNVQKKVLGIYCVVNFMVFPSNSYLVPLAISWFVVELLGIVCRKQDLREKNNIIDIEQLQEGKKCSLLGTKHF